MKLYAPKYYLGFKCIADKCTHSCCVGWEIDVDGEAITRYEHQKNGYGKAVLESVDTTDAPHFKLLENDRCPHLDERGLCRIICELGEEYLCDICREHPRFYNRLHDRCEVGIGMSCEEAARIILTSDNFNEIIEVGEIYGEITDADFDAISLRNDVFSVIKDKETSFTQKIAFLGEKYGAAPSKISKSHWGEVISALEYLDEKNKDRFLGYKPDVEFKREIVPHLERALAYFVYRHCTVAECMENFSASLGFSLFCVQLIASVATEDGVCKDNDSEIIELARTVSEEIEYSEDNTDSIKSEFWGT